MLESYAGRVAAGKPEYEEDSVFCSSLLSNFRAHFTRVKQVGQVGRSLPPCPIGGLAAVASSSPNEIGNMPLRKLDGLRR